MRKKGTKFFALIGMSGFSLAAATIASVAWFISTIKITDINGTGYTDAAYFAYGSGTVDDPFGISEVRHLSNLTWLQYNGQFDDKPYYFELANDINEDGSEYVMPPIGTESHPFIGVFDGNGHTVYNIKITNDYSQFSMKPHNITYNQADAEVIGFFGVVGNLDGESYSSQTNSLHDVTLENLTVESKTTNTLIGLAAGFVNADMSGVKVGTSTIKTNGNTAKTAYTDKLSDYGLVGYTTKTGSSGTFEQRISQYYNSKSQGDDPGWGGSIVIKDFYERLTTLKSNYSQSSSSVPMAYTDTYDPAGNRISHTGSNNINLAMDLYSQNHTKSGVTYNPKIGSLDSYYGTNGIYYLSGGHYTTRRYQEYYTHSGFPLTDGTNYMTVTNRNVASNNRITNTQDSAEALLWSFTNNKLVTKYNNNNYYLYRYNNSNTDLRLTTTANSGITFTKQTSGDKHRYVCTFNSVQYYLKYESGSWRLVTLPTLRQEPTVVNMPTETIAQPAEARMSEPTIWRPASDPGANSHYYYIYSGNNYFNSSGSNSTKTNASATSAVQWNFGTELGNGSVTGNIRNVSNSQYLHLSWWSFIVTVYSIEMMDSISTSNANANWVTTLNTSTHVGSIHSTNPSDRYLRYSNGWGQVNSNSAVNLSIYSVHQAYLDWAAYDANKAVWDAYDANQAAWAAYNAYVADKDAWDIEAAAYAINDAAAYTMVSQTLPDVQGPDTYIDHTETGMEYGEEDATYLPLTVDNNLEAKSTNTGYIVGGSSYASASDSFDYANVRIASFYAISSNLYNYDETAKAFNPNSVWTYDGSGLHNIDDTNNDFVKYAESKGKVEQTLGESSNIYGLHFMTAAINKNNTVKANYALINGDEHTDYKMPANAIDFNLKEQGYVNFFAAPYGNDGNGNPRTVDSFFSLHMIKRNGSNIDDIYEIEQIYSDGVPYHSYIYKFSNGMYSIPYSIDKYNPRKVYILNTKTPLDDVEHGGYADGVYHQINQSTFSTNYSSYQLKFDMDWIKNHSYSSGNNGFHEAFYFEIPTNPGEYALGTVANKTFGAYLMYLDIAANAANKDTITSYAITTFQSGLKYPSGVDFNTTDVVGNAGGETFAIIIIPGQTSDGDIDFTVSGTTIGYDGDFETQYAYSEKPASGASPPTAATLPPSTGIRNIYTHILTTDYQEWDIVVTDILDANGEATSSSIASVRCDGDTVTVDDIPDSFIINSIRPQVSSYIATFTRLSGTNEFVMIPTYSGEEYKTLALTIDMNGTTLSVSNIATGYTLAINGTPVSNGTTYPSL